MGWARTHLHTSEGVSVVTETVATSLVHQYAAMKPTGTGGFRSFVGFMPASRVGVVVLSNCARGTDEIGMRILQALRSTATSDSSRPTS